MECVEVQSVGTEDTFTYHLRIVAVEPKARLLDPSMDWSSHYDKGDPRVLKQVRNNPSLLKKNKPMSEEGPKPLDPRQKQRSAPKVIPTGDSSPGPRTSPPPAANLLMQQMMQVMGSAAAGKASPPQTGASDPRMMRTLSAPTGSPSQQVYDPRQKSKQLSMTAMPEALRTDPRQSHPAPEVPKLPPVEPPKPVVPFEVPKPPELKPLDLDAVVASVEKRTDPRLSRQLSTGTNSDKLKDESKKPLSHRNDPRFKKKSKSDAGNSILSDSSASSSDPSEAAGDPRRSMQRKSILEYSSPLGGGGGDNSPKDSYSSYNRPPNRDPRPTPARPPSQASPEPSQPPVSAAMPLLPDQMEMPPLPALDEPSLKEVFKTIDPTASPFC